MLINEVMFRLNTEYEINFLLTAYIETLQFYDAVNRLPPGVVTLPLRGIDDIESRYTDLRGAELCGLARSQCNSQAAIAHEATVIFGAAFTRLKTLRISSQTPRESPTAAPAS